jgi:uncharacterized protein (TIGR03086 family)
MTFVDLQPAAMRMADLITEIPDGLLSTATPCPNYSLGDLLDHIDSLALAFTAAAAKTALDAASESPSGDVTRLGNDWRTRLPRNLTALAEAWRAPAARTGMTRAGGIDMPGEVAAVVALEELVIHGWDVACAIQQGYDCDQRTLEVVRDFVAQFAGPDQAELRGDAYASPVAVPEAAPLLDRVIALSGRDPGLSGRP